ncbi:MAG: tetratricopeptide repeat protein [Thiobacillus sp.]|nr:tetratricopeptide repeat protein [Thiobacillus sp.]
MHYAEKRAEQEAKCRPAAEQGDAEAQFQLARLYESYSPGTDTKERRTAALRWFLKAAEQGHVIAQYRLGLYYRHGVGTVAKDQAEGDVWFSKAAAQGHIGAMMHLGRYREAADLGNPLAQCKLGDQSIEKDPAEAMSWYLKAFNNADSLEGWDLTAGEAAYQIAKMYEEGRGIPKNDETAVAWLFKAAEKGDPKAPWDIADRYAKGIGIPKDTAVAAEWYVEAESRDANFEPEGSDLQKTCKARGVPLKEMLTAYRKAAESCEVWAMYLADLYKYGWGIPPDRAESQKWRRRAAAESAHHLVDVEAEGGVH